MLGGPGTYSLLLVILSVWCQGVYGGGSENQPKLMGRDGGFVLQAAKDKNITVRLQGSSAFMINEVDMLSTLRKRSQPTKPKNFDENVFHLPFEVQRLERAYRRLAGRVRIVENRNNSLSMMRLVGLLSRLGVATGRYNQMVANLTDKCASNPCKNGGDCYGLLADFHCDCPDSWTGKTCETDVNECNTFNGTDLGCQNNATCVNSDGSYRCVCATGYSGIHCRERKSDCEKSAPGELCGKGTCIPANNELGYNCICNAGWKTDNISQPCTVDVNECVEAHVMCHTTCINLPGTFTCGPCPSGYTGNGIKCQDIDECAVNNGGCSTFPRVQCINAEGSFHCGKCPPGWTGNGRVCMQVESNSCGPDNICHPQALCQYVSNVQVCQCPAGMTGTGYGPAGCVGISVDPCSAHQCKNGGTCVSRGTTHSCICPPGYRPPFCDRRSACAQRPCLNGGMCVDDESAAGFHCVCSRGATGPLCQQKQLSCGSVLRDRSGELTYPASGLYDAGKTCAWGIRTDFNLTLNVTFSRFDIEEHPECGKDWLQINDGRSLATPLIGRFCGNKLPNGGNILSSHNTLLLWFRSDNSTNFSGFSLKWNSIAPICGGQQKLDDQAQGIIRSPGYPGKSPRGRDCEWTLEAPFGRRILLRFYEVEMNTKANCTRNQLIIYDSGEVLENICVTGTPAPIYTASNVAKIHYHTSMFFEDSLFQMHYEVVAADPGCGGVHSEPKGKFRLTSDMKNCNFLIQLPPGTRVSANITKGEPVYGSPTIKIFDGRTDDDPLLMEFAGDAFPTQLVASQNFMLISMTMNQSPIDLAGTVVYEVSYNLVCGEELSDPLGGTFTTPNYPKPYFAGLHCKYVISGPLNSVVHLNITDYDVSEFEDSCNDDTDFVEIFYNAREPAKRHCKDVPTHIVSAKNHLRIDFHSSGNPQRRRGISVTYSFEEIGCGGVLREPDGSFTASESTTQCEWILEAPESDVIALSLDYARVGTNCAPGDSDVQIFLNNTNTDEARLVQSLCGGEKQVRTVLFSNLATVFLRPLPSGLNTGLTYGIKANYTFTKRSTRCGGNITDLSGNIQSPGFPGKYPNSVNCTWVIHAPLGHQIELVPRLFAIEPSSSQCLSDYLEIRNGMSEQSPLIGRFCGDSILPHIPSFTNHLYLHFHSDASVTAAGFDILFQQTSNGCGGSLSSHSGSIASPHYPEISSGPVQCDWKITVSRGSSIDVQIQRLSPTADFCSNNVLGVYDGADTLAKQLKMNCSNSNSTIVLRSTGNTIFVRYALLGNTTADGQQFYLSYMTNCRQVLNDMEGVIESPNFASAYPDNLKCEWTIVGRRADNIALTFSHFELEKGDLTCQRDQFEVIDMKGEEILEMRKLCNALETGYMFTSDGNKVVVKFTSDYSNSGSGFRLEFKRNGCGGYETRPRGSLKTPNAPYSVDLDCEWLIETSPGMLIVLDISDKRMETETADCATNGLIIKNNKDDEHYLLKECKSEAMRMSVTAQGTTMYIRFYTDSKRSMKYMKAFYWTKAAQCGGIFRSHSGTIMSPNYPNNYNQPSMCEWMITTEDAFLLNLEFATMDIPVAENCSKGFVEVYNGRRGEQNAKLLRRFCESGRDLSVRSTGHMVHVILNSNGGPPAKGFLMRFKKQCGFDLVQSSGLLKSYIQDQPCQWLYNPTDSEAKLSITILKLECHCDGAAPDVCRRTRGLRIYDLSSNSTLQHSFCEKAPTEVTLTGSRVIGVSNVVSVVAKYSIGAATCGGVLTSLRGIITSPYYPSVYPMDTECIWTIEAAPGNNIELSIDEMNLSPSDRCNRDYVEVREKTQQGNLLGAFCSNESASQMFTVYDKVWIKFHSSDTSFGVSSGGFKLSWTYAQLNELSGSKGRIEPPSITMLRFEPAPFVWRINVARDNVITLTFKEYNDGLQLFDGFDEDALRIDIQVSPWEVTSSSNVVMMRTDNKIVEHFRLDWQVQSKAAIKENTTISKCSEDINVGPMGIVDLTSPGYPNGYETGLKCEWIVKADRPNRHAVVRLYDVRLENLMGCIADYLQVFTSHNLQDWHEEFRICDGPPKTMLPFRVVHGTPHLKLKFVTDLSVNATGFKSTLFSYCGGNLTDPVGRIVGADFFEDLLNGNCTWQIQVRPGRRIKFTFDFPSNTGVNSSDQCVNYGIIREGITDDGPIVPPGRICPFKQFNKTVISSTNHVTVKFYMNPAFTNPFFRLEMKEWNVTYREYSVCGGEVRLTPYSRSVNFTSPNYPHVPNPHTECIWLIVAPPGESVKAEFVDQFSMNARRCDREFVELRDGSTQLARQLGKFCRRPETIRSSGNVLYLRYLTDIPEPRNGFKVNVSLSTCGGTSTQFNGFVISPNYPAPGGYPPRSVCDYVIKVNPHSRLNLTFLDLHLPFDSSNLNESDRIVIYQKSDSAPEELGDELTVIYGNTTVMPVVLVDSNMVVVRFHTFKANNMYRGFRIKYDRMYGFCFREVSGESGVLSLYMPSNRRIAEHCRWQITVPKGRRVKADITNVVTAIPGAALPPNFRVSFYNDFLASSQIASADFSNVTTLPSVLSSDNMLYVVILGLRPYLVRGLRLTYSSLEPSNCPDDITADRGALSLANVNHSRSFFCRSQIILNGRETLSLNITSQEVEFAKSRLVQQCVRYQSRSLTESQFTLCANFTNKNFLIPVKRSSLMMHQNDNVKLRKLEATYIKHQCGGEYIAQDQVKITVPTFESTYGRLDCGWVIFAGANSGYELTGTFDFRLPCRDEYVAVYAGSTSNNLEIARFCNNGTFNSTRLNSANMYIEYRTAAYSAQSSLQMTIKKASVCGEKVIVDRMLQFTNSEYRNNQECVWDLEVREGFFLRLEFIGRFFIEDSKDCVKDYVEVRKLDGGAWVSVGRFCGRELPPPVNTTSQHMQLIFRTDDTVTADGFTVMAIKTCDGVFNVTETPQKIIYPPKWTMAMVRLSCNYTLLTDSEKYIKVKFNKMDIGYRQLCGLSQMRIRKRNSHQDMEELGPYCKSNELTVVKAKNYMSLAYLGLVETGAYEFEFSLETCGGEVTRPQWIESQQNDQGTGYMNRMNCVWNITAPADHSIVIQFKYLHMELSEDCRMDYVEIFRGPLMQEQASEKRICGNQTQSPPIIHIDSNRAVVAAVSDYWVSYDGFMARIIFSKSCKERLTLTQANTPTEIYREQVIGRDEVMYCDYSLMAPDGFRIKIDLEVIEVNPKNVTCPDNCENCDYIEILDSERMGQLRMTKVCRPLGETRSLMSSFKDAVIRAHLERKGSPKYKLNLRLVEANCGGQLNFDLKADSPVRITPALGANKLYLPNTHCIWRISSDSNFDVRFENFSLQNASDVTGECLDYLQIKSRYNSRSTTRKHCGAVSSYVIKAVYFTGTPKVMEITFHTDETIESTGFTLTAAQTPSCNTTYNSTNGVINAFFILQSVCTNDIALSDNTTVNIVMRPIYFSSQNCSINYIKATDLNANKELFNDCSYDKYGTRILTATNRVRVEVRVPMHVNFELFYYGSPKALPPGCGGSLDMPQGYVVSPAYGTFENATMCRWNITTVSPNRINLRFSEIHMGTKCHTNYLDIIEIDSNGVEKVTQHYCNRDVETIFVSTSNRVAFASSTTPHFDGTGWNLRFQISAPGESVYNDHDFFI